MLNKYNTLALMKDRLIAATITGLGKGNINLVTTDAFLPAYAMKYVNLSYGGLVSSGGYGGGNLYQFWLLDVDIHVIHAISAVNATRRFSEDCHTLANQVLRAYHLWYPRIWTYSISDTYKYGDYVVSAGSIWRVKATSITATTPSEGANFTDTGLVFTPGTLEEVLLQPIGFASENNIQSINVNGRLEYKITQQYTLSTLDEASAFDDVFKVPV